MAKSKDTVAASYDLIRDRVARGEKIADAIEAELPASGIATATLRAAYLGLAREKGHTRVREAKPALDIEAFKARFDALVAEREARQRTDFSTVAEQLGDHLRDIASRHPPAWVRATIVASGVPVTKEQFFSWLGEVAGAASKKQKGARSSPGVRGGSALPSEAQGEPESNVEPRAERSAAIGDGSEPQRSAAAAKSDGNESEPHRTVPSAKPPRPKVLGVQAR